MQNTLKVFQETLSSRSISSALIANPNNVYYLSGFRGVYPPEVLVGYFFSPDGFLISPAVGQSTLCVDPRYKGISFEGVKKLKVAVIARKRTDDFIYKITGKLVRKPYRQTVGLELRYLTYVEGKKIVDFLTKKKMKVVDISDIIVKQRAKKSPEEIEKLKQACAVSDKIFHKLLRIVRPGMTEAEVARKIEEAIRGNGCEVAFETDVASGPNSAIPHYKTGQRKIDKRDIVLMDFGARYKGYNADITRTVFVGRPTAEQINCYEAVLEAQAKALNFLKPGISGRQVHLTAVRVLADKGLDRYFTHSLGHGIGLFIHEDPTLRLRSVDILEEGNTFTIEPGVYLLGKFGIRIEDSVLLTKTGPDRLTTSSKELISI